jgi:hypothetical protein
MRRDNLFTAFFLLMVIALFVYGVTELLLLRFQKGDVYPPYSSYRSDPLGTKVFFEGLGLLRGPDTVRNVEPLPAVPGLSETALFLFGLEPSDFSIMPHVRAKALEDAASGGGRIVISFVPTDAKPVPPSHQPQERELPKEGVDQDEEERSEFCGEGFVDLAKRWGVQAKLSAETDEEASLSAPEEDLPPSLAWHSTRVFELKDEAWRTLYTRAGKPVIIERSYGKGAIILSSDSFFISNEAMKKDRSPRLLSWLCGTYQKIIFDETHLGVSRSHGVATLLRRYGLTPFFASLMLLALLLLWKQSARFLPPYDEGEQTPVDGGKDSSTGFTHLLRRNIAPRDLLTACLEEWKRSFTHGRQNRSGLLPRIQEIIDQDRVQPKKNRNPVQAYRKISALGRRR